MTIDEILAERWRMLDTDVERDRETGGFTDNKSKAYWRITETAARLGSRMIGGTAGQVEVDALFDLRDHVWDAVTEAVMAFAADIEAKRAARQEGTAA